MRASGAPSQRVVRELLVNSTAACSSSPEQPRRVRNEPRRVPPGIPEPRVRELERLIGSWRGR